MDHSRTFRHLSTRIGTTIKVFKIVKKLFKKIGPFQQGIKYDMLNIKILNYCPTQSY
jgi:hypothetical protein